MKKRLLNMCATRNYRRAVLSTFGMGCFMMASSLPVMADAGRQPSQTLEAQSEAPALTAQAADRLRSQQVTAGSAAMENARLVLSLRSRRVYLYQGDMLRSSYPVAIGTAETPTPQGEFTVSKMVENPVWQSPWTGEIHEPGPNSALGLRWIEFTSTEAGAFGFHGTPTVESIGHAASNGCVRMYNEDVVALFSQVSVGTPVSVRP